MLNLIKVISIIGLFFTLNACSESQHKALFGANSNAIGAVGDVLIVTEPKVWEEGLKDSVSVYLEDEYLILPRPEPIFNVIPIPGKKFLDNNIIRTRRTILLIADLSTSTTTSNLVKQILGEENLLKAKNDPSFCSAAQKDLWVKGQTVIYFFSYGLENLRNNFAKSAPKIITALKKADQLALQSKVYSKGIDRELSTLLKNKFDIALKVPDDYSLGHEAEDFVWIRRETTVNSSSVFIYETDYTKETQLSKENLLALRDTLGKKYFATPNEGSYMVSDDSILPILTDTVSLNGSYAVRARGLWKMENDFMGGAFVSYMLYDETRKKVVLIDGFVHAPGKPKRPLMERVKYIMQSYNKKEIQKEL